MSKSFDFIGNFFGNNFHLFSRYTGAEKDGVPAKSKRKRGRTCRISSIVKHLYFKEQIIFATDF